MITEAGWIFLATFGQAALIFAKAFDVIGWPWLLVCLPVEVLLICIIGSAIWLVSTRGNPFQ